MSQHKGTDEKVIIYLKHGNLVEIQGLLFRVIKAIGKPPELKRIYREVKA